MFLIFLPLKENNEKNKGPGEIRTRDLLFTRQAL